MKMKIIKAIMKIKLILSITLETSNAAVTPSSGAMIAKNILVTSSSIILNHSQ